MNRAPPQPQLPTQPAFSVALVNGTPHHGLTTISTTAANLVSASLPPQVMTSKTGGAGSAPTFYIIQQPPTSAAQSGPSTLPQQPLPPQQMVTPPAPNAKGRKRKRQTGRPAEVTLQPGSKKVRVNNVAVSPLNSAPNPAKSALPSTTTIESANTDSEARAIQKSYVTTDGRHVCGECGNALATSWGLDAHIKSVHGKKGFKCDYCDKAFGRKDHLVNHTKSMHTKTKECSQCGVVCSGKDGLSKHISEAHPILPTLYHQCSECGQNYPTEDACKLHIQQEHSIVSCKDCGDLCVGTEGLKQHVVKKHQQPQKGLIGGQAQQPFQIVDCESTFDKGGEYDEQFIQNQIYCKIGNELVRPDLILSSNTTPSTTSTSNPHQTVIQNTVTESPLKIQLPDQPLPPSQLSGVAPAHVASSAAGQQQLNIVFQCTHCDSLFTEQSQLTKHMDSTHPETFALPTEPLPPSVLQDFQGLEGLHQNKAEKVEASVYFQCLICEELFDKAASLHTHMEQKHGSNSNSVNRSVVTTDEVAGQQQQLTVLYECEHCRSFFTSKPGLESHILEAHGQTQKGKKKTAGGKGKKSSKAAAAAAAAAATTASAVNGSNQQYQSTAPSSSSKYNLQVMLGQGNQSSTANAVTTASAATTATNGNANRN